MKAMGRVQSNLGVTLTLFATHTSTNVRKMKFTICSINIGIKHDFPFINIRKVPREVLKTEGEARGFQHIPRDIAYVNE